MIVNNRYQCQPPKVNQAEGVLSGFKKEREEIMQKMQPSVQPSEDRKKKMSTRRKKPQPSSPGGLVVKCASNRYQTIFFFRRWGGSTFTY